MYKPSGYVASRGLAAYKRRLYASGAQAAATAARRAVTPRVPQNGYTRTTLAYKRSIPRARRGDETHYNDCTFSEALTQAGNLLTFTSVSPTSAAPDNPAGDSLNLIAQGTTKNERIGNKLMLHAIRLKGSLIMPTSATSTNSWARIVLVLDKQANGAVPAPSDIFESTAAATTDLFAFQNMDNADRFQIIKDKRINIEPAGYGVQSTSQAQVVKFFKMNHKCKTEIAYSSTTGAITEVKSNNYVVVLFSSAGSVTFTGKSRVYWRE